MFIPWGQVMPFNPEKEVDRQMWRLANRKNTALRVGLIALAILALGVAGGFLLTRL